MIGRGQFETLPFAEGRRPSADVHDHIIDRTLKHHDQLPLGVRLLIVQPAQGACDGAGKVILNKPLTKTCFGISLLMECFTEQSSLVPKDCRFDQERAGNFEPRDLHSSRPLGGLPLERPSGGRGSTISGWSGYN